MVDCDLSSTYKDRLLRVTRPTAGGVSEIGTSGFNAIPGSGEGDPAMKRAGVLEIEVTAFPYFYISFIKYENVFSFVSENLRARNRPEERSIGLK